MKLVDVVVRYGVLRGTESHGVRVFKGVPYAAAPVGERRFAAPRACDLWSGVRDASVFASPSLQPTAVGALTGYLGSEDCLYLNVYAPAASQNCPVMVWIHPGGGVVGSPNDCDGTAFALDGVVVVTIAYRLGVLGLLSLPGVFGEEAESNFALLDMIAALRWVNENIGEFNGDPHRVTLAGVSNGGRSVVTLLAAPSARGLFNQVLVMSGTGGGYIVAEPDEAQHVTDAVCTALDVAQRPSALRAVAATDLLQAQNRVGQSMATLLPYKAVVDGRTLTRRPIDVIRDGLAKDVPMLIGTDRNEFDFFAAQPVYDPWRKSRTSMVAGKEEMDEARAHYRRLRPTWNASQVDDDVMSASEWWIPAIRAAESHVARGGRAWMYRLDWRIAAWGDGLGAPHGLDLPLMSPVNAFHAQMVRGAGERAGQLDSIMEEMHRAIARFLFADAPSESSWPNYNTSDRSTFIYDVASTLREDPDEELREVWSSLIE